MKPTSYRCKYVSRYCCNKLLNAQLDNALSLVAILNLNYFSMLKRWLSNAVLAYQIPHINLMKDLAIIRAICKNQRQSSRGVLWKRCSYKFHKILRKTQAFFSEFCEIIKNNFLIESLWWLLLKSSVFRLFSFVTLMLDFTMK